MKKVEISIKKKTIQEAYSSIMLLNQIGTTYAQKGEPLYDLVMEIKRDIKKQFKQKQRKNILYAIWSKIFKK